MTKGQQAMAVAMIYPEPNLGGDRKSAKAKSALKIKGDPASKLVNPGLLSQARTVLKHLPELAKRSDLLRHQP